MELARAFTKRSKRPEGLYGGPTRTFSTRKHDGTVNHNFISSPVRLLSATNALAYDAPALHPASDSESQMSSLPSSRDTTPDTSSIECAPSPIEENHLTNFFRNPGPPLSPKTSVRRSNSSADGSFAARMRSSLQKSHTISSQDRDATSATPAVPDAVMSQDKFTENNHPFGAELAKVAELAEEIGGSNALIRDEDERYLVSCGLQKWTAHDYVDDLASYFGNTSMNPFLGSASAWI